MDIIHIWGIRYWMWQVKRPSILQLNEWRIATWIEAMSQSAQHSQPHPLVPGSICLLNSRWAWEFWPVARLYPGCCWRYCVGKVALANWACSSLCQGWSLCWSVALGLPCLWQHGDDWLYSLGECIIWLEASLAVVKGSKRLVGWVWYGVGDGRWELFY